MAFRDRYKFPYRIIHRADLQAALLEGVQRHELITLETGASIAGVLEQPDGLLIRIARRAGTGVVSAELLVGADGVWSALRERIAESAAPVASGMTAWRAVLSGDIARGLAAMDRVCLWLGREGHVAHYPVAKGAALNIVAIVPEQWDRSGWNAPGDPAELRSRFTGWSENLRSLIAAPLAWQKFAVHTVDPAGPWTEGRIVLLGDAAHAMLPYLAQGAAAAMEDGVVLAHHLRGAPDIPSALRGYERERKERVARIAAAAAATASHYHATGTKAAFRDLALRIAGRHLILGRNDWIYRWRLAETPSR